MEPAAGVDDYDPSLYGQVETACEVETESECVQSPAAQAEDEDEGHCEEGDPGLTGDVSHKDGIKQEGEPEGDHDHGGDVGHEDDIGDEVDENREVGVGGQEPGQQLAEMGHVAAAAAPHHENPPLEAQHLHFTPDQEQELRSAFELTPYPDLCAR